MMKHHQVLGAGELRQFDTHDVAGMTPVFLHRDLLGEGIHRIEDEEVCIAEVLDERITLVESFVLVLGIGGIHNHFVLVRKAVAVGIPPMILQKGPNRHAANDVVAATRFELNKFYRRTKSSKIDWKAGVRLLALESLAHDLVAAVDADHVAGNISGCKKGKTHDVIPVQMRQKYVVASRVRGAVLGED